MLIHLFLGKEVFVVLLLVEELLWLVLDWILLVLEKEVVLTFGCIRFLQLIVE